MRGAGPVDAPDERFDPAVEGVAYFAVLGCLRISTGRATPVEVVIRREGDVLRALDLAGVDACHAGTGPRRRPAAGRHRAVDIPAGRCWHDHCEDPMRVALAEDGALFREGLLMLLKAAGHEVVGVHRRTATRWSSCCARGPADVAILDIRMPPEPDGGLLTAERLRAAHPDMGLLFLSHYAESHYLMRILQIGTERSATGSRRRWAASRC